MKKDLQESIKSLYDSVPPSSKEDGLEETILRVRQLVVQSQYNKASFWQFFFAQFSLIRKKVWIIQMLIVLLCSIRLFCFSDGIDTLVMISSTAPLLILAGIQEVTRSYKYKTLEIELSTIYSFKQLILTRITILGLVDIFILTIVLILSGINLNLNLIVLILYIFVPFLVTCFTSLFILNYFKNTDCNYMCIVMGIATVALITVTATFWPNLYKPSAYLLWGVLFIVAFIGVVVEMYKLVKNCSENSGSIYTN
ncbi:hypothetical protein [Clostridium botulinum]|uniref:hypothetical protein n=1 Tax=Clostridium botulinum TaxID=1491 RepID=UPI0004D97626|nr:hypothetical protein [Clostridium botulinum]KEI06942.1 membrane protein [Clostridium botulinum C/D str. BKT75002]KEI08238.1 membrane protein [Clostridium botulinum C/D str. BKT2873]QPW60256.1 hypothetical protein IG390_11110 [Clostridium botulinum]